MRTLVIALGATALAYAMAVLALFLAGRHTAAREVAMLLPNLAKLGWHPVLPCLARARGGAPLGDPSFGARWAQGPNPRAVKTGLAA
jgi:hypothetical protein